MTYTFQLNFVDAEIPLAVGNLLYLQHQPEAGSLQLFRNGVMMTAAFGDYALAGQAVKLIPDLTPDDKVVCFYRWTA